MYEITLTHTIDTGHRIVGHEGGTGKCARLHGHTYRYEVTVSAPSLLPIGFVTDFGAIKRALDEWDHRVVLWDQDHFAQDLRTLLDGATEDGTTDMERMGIVLVPFNPTAEHMAWYWAGRIYNNLRISHGKAGQNIREEGYAVEVEVWETPKSCARYVTR